MLLGLAPPGERFIIKKIIGRADTLSFLHGLGCVEGAEITVIAAFEGNLIIKIKESRVALDKRLANCMIV